jgi:DNA primase catalytic core
MARLSDEIVSRIKQEVSLVRLAEAKGFTLKPHGKDYAIHCPFHPDDNTPSLIITPSVNLFHCPACGAKGSPIDWVMKTEGVSTRHALELLANDLPHLAADTTKSGEPKIIKHNTQQKLPSVLADSADHQTALRQCNDFYHETLKSSSEGLGYLEQRGLKSAELIDTFKLGHANRTLAYRLPQKNRQEGAEIRGLLQEIGILRESGHEHFNGCLVVPIMDENGVITEMYGRKLLGNRLRKGTAQHLYLPGPHVGVWNIQAFKSSKEIILCEALIDAMTFWCAGYRNVTSSYGTAGFTHDHLQALLQHEIERVLIAYDRDEAGNQAADKLAKKLMEHGIDCFRVLLPKGMDVNEYALKMQPANKSLGLALRTAEWMGNGKKPTITTGQTTVVTESECEATNKKNSNETLTPLAANQPSMTESPVVNVTNLDAEVSDHEVNIPLGKRHYRIRGLNKNLSYEQLKINLLIKQGEAFHVDTFDMYSARHRSAYIKQAAYELGVKEEVIKSDLGKVLLKLEELQDQHIKGTLAKQDKAPLMSDEDVKEALALLKTPCLVDRILQDFSRCGVVGEEINKQVGYLAAVSRKLESPLAVMVQSSSAAGKSSLMESILAFIPEEERIQYSAMTGQSLFYMGEKDLKHKILAIAEEEGASNASYALKLLQSEGQVSIASTGKNATTGNLETQDYTVEGPVMLFSTTTAIDLDEELLNRCITLSVDESREQTRAIHAAQRKRRTLEGQRARKDKQKLIKLHQNAQRLLRPLGVMNPYADYLTFLDDKTRMRRDHEKYLGLIDAIALLHQYQRNIVKDTYDGETCEYVQVAIDDIELANRLAHDVLGRTLDELPPQTRRLLELMTDMVQEACKKEQIEQSAYRFTRKQVRHACGWTDFQVKKHMMRLEDLEYVLVHSGGRGKSMVYELLYNGEGQDDTSFLMGLIDVKKLRYDDQKEPLKANKEPSSSPQRAPKVPPSSPSKNHKNTINTDSNGEAQQKAAKSTIRGKNNGASHRTYISPSLAAKAVEV